jgi:hypothetical protein
LKLFIRVTKNCLTCRRKDKKQKETAINREITDCGGKPTQVSTKKQALSSKGVTHFTLEIWKYGDRNMGNGNMVVIWVIWGHNTY